MSTRHVTVEIPPSITVDPRRFMLELAGRRGNPLAIWTRIARAKRHDEPSRGRRATSFQQGVWDGVEMYWGWPDDLRLLLTSGRIQQPKLGRRQTDCPVSCSAPHETRSPPPAPPRLQRPATHAVHVFPNAWECSYPPLLLVLPRANLNSSSHWAHHKYRAPDSP